MGIPAFKSCYTNINQPAPNPDPSFWLLLDKAEFKNGYALKVLYYGCTNFEGVKIMVYSGKYQERSYLDPHFSREEDSPIARFQPTEMGWLRAMGLASSL